MNPVGQSTPNNLRLEIGGSLQLEHLDRQELRFNVDLIGWSTGESIIVKPPELLNWMILLTPQSSLAARVFSGTNAYGFQTSVLCIHHDPFEYLHLLYPEQVSSVKVRQTSRIKIDIEAGLTTAEHKVMGVHVLDISQTGIAIFGPANIGNKGDHLDLTLELSIGGESLQFSHEVIIRNRRQANSDTNELIYGMEFNALDAKKISLLSQFLYEQIG